jgi:hypothetical protein
MFKVKSIKILKIIDIILKIYNRTNIDFYLLNINNKNSIKIHSYS